MKKFSNIIWGLILIAIGLIFSLNTLGLTNINLFFDGWWTLIIIIPCLIGLIKGEEIAANITCICIGVALLLGCQNIISFSTLLKLFVPVVIILIGLSLLFKDTFKRNTKKMINELNSKRNPSENNYCTTFSGQDISFDGRQFNGGEFTAVFGGIKLDLSNALINENVVINVSATFGGIDVFVPDDVNVKTSATCIFGGISDKRKNKPKKNEATNTVYITGTCLFGGVDIK